MGKRKLVSKAAASARQEGDVYSKEEACRRGLTHAGDLEASVQRTIFCFSVH